MSIQSFITGLIILAASVVLLINRLRFTGMLGHNNVFERKLGSGATFNLVTIGSFIVVIVGISTMFGFGDNLILFLTSPIRNALN